MAKRITDDFTCEEITYPYLSVSSIRVELTSAKYVWLGEDKIKFFKDGTTFGQWVDRELQSVLAEENEEESY